MNDIDIEIAEKLMGWSLCAHGDDMRHAKTEEEYADACINDGWCWDGRDSDDEAWQWKPSTDPACAALVREHLAKRWDWILGCGRASDSAEPPFGFALYEKGKPDNEVVIAEANTEEMAVAICAIKSLGPAPRLR